MCQSFEAEAKFVSHMDQIHGKCSVCGGGWLSCTWLCEGNDRFEEYFNSKMFDPSNVTWSDRSKKDYRPFYMEKKNDNV